MTLRTFSIDQDNCAFRIVDGEAILIQAETTFYYGLNGPATQAWQLLLDGDVTAAQIATELHAGEGDPPAALAAAASAFLEELARERLLTVEGDAPAEDAAGIASNDDSLPQVTKFDSLDDLLITGE